MISTPGITQGPSPERVDVGPARARLDSFPTALRSPHILVMDGDLDALEQAGRLLSGHGFGITLSSALLDDATCAFLGPDLVIVDLATVLPAEARRLGERHVLDTLLDVNVPIVLCRSSLRRGQGSGRPGVAILGKPFQPVDFLPAVEALLYWRAEQRRSRTLPLPAATLAAPAACEPG